MAELSGFKVHKVYDEDHYLLGYTMELVEWILLLQLFF
jgi:hypothetical protein